MLASADTIEVVADAFRRYDVTTSVVDPVRSCHTRTLIYERQRASIKRPG